MNWIILLTSSLILAASNCAAYPFGIPDSHASGECQLDEYELNDENRIVLRKGFLEKNFRIGHNRRLLEKQLRSKIATSDFSNQVGEVTVQRETKSIQIEVVVHDVGVIPETLGILAENTTEVVTKSDLSDFQIAILDEDGAEKLRATIRASNN